MSHPVATFWFSSKTERPNSLFNARGSFHYLVRFKNGLLFWVVPFSFSHGYIFLTEIWNLECHGFEKPIPTKCETYCYIITFCDPSRESSQLSILERNCITIWLLSCSWLDNAVTCLPQLLGISVCITVIFPVVLRQSVLMLWNKMQNIQLNISTEARYNRQNPTK